MEGILTSPVRQILASAGLERPDGRPLYRYPILPGQMAALRDRIRARILSGNHLVAAEFVFWAAEHFRARFPEDNYRRWDFVWAGLGLRGDDSLGRSLAEQGLRWWNRPVHRANDGRQMQVYTLFAEGGLPQSLLAQQGLYQRVLLSLIRNLDAEGGLQAASLAEGIAAHCIDSLPQAFQTDEIIGLLAELGLALIQLRAELPEDLPDAGAQAWLDRNRPNWTEILPLRMSPEVAEKLIRPALVERPAATDPLASRELRRGSDGSWQCFLRLQEQGFLARILLPGVASDARFRLLPINAANLPEAPVYVATPDTNGWRLRRFGRHGPAVLPLAPDLPFVLGAFVDGRPVGQVVVTPALPEPAEQPSLWRALDAAEAEVATRLVPQPGSGRTRAACVWLLAAGDTNVVAEPGVSVSEPEPAANGRLWRLSGQGSVSAGAQHMFNLRTRSDDEATEARLVPVGDVLRSWRTAREGELIYRGRPRILGETGAGGLQELSDQALRAAASTSRRFGQTTFEWLRGQEVLARLRVISLPADASITLAETAPGSVRLTVRGLPAGLRLALRAGAAEARGSLPDGAGELSLRTEGAPAGQLILRLADALGRSLELTAPWPAASGLILDPDGRRLERDRPMAVEELLGWRGVVPEGVAGDLVLRLAGHQPVALPVQGELPLYPFAPLIRALLAQGGPDAQVNLNLVVGGTEGRRLEIRRYRDYAKVEEDYLRAGLQRDVPPPQRTALADQFDKKPITLHAVNLTAPDTVRIIKNETSRDLRILLGERGGPWLIQARLTDRVQRAVAWAPRSLPFSTRADRIASYRLQLDRLLERPESDDWRRLSALVTNLNHGGDAGVADQIQALGHAPAAAVALALRVSKAALADILALDTAAPLFWPAVSVTAFERAIRTDHERRLAARERRGFLTAEAREEADASLGQRLGDVLNNQPTLKGHVCAALCKAGMQAIAINLAQARIIEFFPDPLGKLKDLAQEAARRAGRVPTGLRHVPPLRRPAELAGFAAYLQPVIDAPLTTAEFAAERRPAASAYDLVTLINLRLVDPLYFDAALPAAIALALRDAES